VDGKNANGIRMKKRYEFSGLKVDKGELKVVDTKRFEYKKIKKG